MAMRLGSLHGPHALLAQALGLILVFVGERLIGEPGSLRWALSGFGAALCLLSFLVLTLAWLRSADQARRVEGLASLLSLVVLFALGLYALSSDLWQAAAARGLSWQAAAWPILLVAGFVPFLFLQWSLASMGRGRGIEHNRIRTSVGAGLSLGLFVCTLFLVNAVVDRKDVHVDLSYSRTSAPSESSLEMVGGLDSDLELLLFFPDTNQVLEEARGYFDALVKTGSRLKMRTVDRALEPSLAEKHRVARTGTVVLVRGGNSQKIELGEKLKRAKVKLRKLDDLFQTALLKLTTDRQAVYMLTGHEERGAKKREGDLRPRLSLLKKYFESKNLSVKPLGAMEGLPETVPSDATLLVWAGPRKRLVPGELKALETYLAAGGRMLIMLDPESGALPSADLLASLGLVFEPAKLAHPRFFVPFTKTRADMTSIVTNKFSSHAATGFVNRYSQDLAIVFPSTGSLIKVKGSKQRVHFLVRSRENSWADADGDLQRGPSEALREFALAAAVQKKIENPDKQPVKDGDAPILVDDEMRVVVFADADVFADPFLFFPGGNHHLLADVLKWLMGRRRIGGATTREEDVAVLHSRDENVFWFYGTVFFVPLGILGLGFVTRWGRGRSRGRSQ